MMTAQLLSASRHPRWNFVFTVLATRRVSVAINGQYDEPLATDEGNLMPLANRKRMAAALAAQLNLNGDDATAFGEELESQWLAFFARGQKPAAPKPKRAGLLLVELSAESRDAGRDMLDDPDLLKRLQQDFEAVGIAGESRLALTIYLVGVSRLLDNPLSARIHGPSTSGKSHVIATIAELFPSETILRATHLTPHALFHMPPGTLAHRFIVAGERSRRNNDDSAEATRALREMMSAGKLSKLMPVRIGGQMVSHLVEQDGPIAFAESTTLATVFDEDANRCLTLHTDEQPNQTERILQKLSEIYQGQTTSIARQGIVQKHYALHRWLQPCQVVVPFATRLAELLDCRHVELRRGYPQIMSMIQAITLLHQFQRERDDKGRLIATADDYRQARRLLLEPMQRLLGSGIPAPALRYFERLVTWAKGQPFTTTVARQHETHGKSSVLAWLNALEDAGLVRVIIEGRGRSPATWELTGNSPEDTAAVLPKVAQVCDAAVSPPERAQ